MAQAYEESDEQYVKASEAAKLLHTTRSKIAELLANGTLPHVNDPMDRRAKLIPVSAIDRLLRIREGRVGDPKALQVA